MRNFLDIFLKKFSIGREKDTIFVGWLLQRKQMLLPDMFDSSGGPPGKYCHTGTGPSAHTSHSPSALKAKKPFSIKMFKPVRHRNMNIQ